MATEKKIIHVGYRLPETLAAQIKCIAAAKGISESEFVRMACSLMVQKELDYINSLNNSLGRHFPPGNEYRVEPCSTPDPLQENTYGVSE